MKPRPVPIFLKIAPDLTDAELGELAQVALEAGIAGIVATNTTLARNGLRNRHAREGGGLSGQPLFVRSTTVLAKLHALTGGRLPLVGVGGVGSAEQAYAKIRAGASAVQLYTALVYARVSTKEQAGGGDGDGFSLPAQRDACRRKAESLGAAVVEEFVDKGESAKTADRPELQRLLKVLPTRSVDFVIVHKIDRLARNRADDVALTAAIQASGAKLVSVTENIDETPSGTLLHGIMASISEFYSKNLAAEVSKGMDQKAKKGGRPGKAPVGYLNTREITDDGHEIRTVVVHPEHGEQRGHVGRQGDEPGERDPEVQHRDAEQAHHAPGEHDPGHLRRGRHLPDVVEQPEPEDHDGGEQQGSQVDHRPTLLP